MELLSLAVSIAVLLASVVAFLLRDAIRTWLTKGIAHKFEMQLETFRADLRAKEENIAALRQNALSGASRRREALDKRRLEAIDRLWTSVVSLGHVRLASKLMESVNFEKSSELVLHDANARKLFETLGKTIDVEKMPKIEGARERPFISDKAWALYSAYSAILWYGVAQLKTLEFGADAKLLNHKNVDELLRVALPHQAVNLDQFGTSFCHFCVDELEQALLNALKKDLDGNDASEEDIRTAAQILSASENVMASLEKSVISQ